MSSLTGILDEALVQLEAAEAITSRPEPKCAEWLDRFGWTYDPRLTTPEIPFRLFPRQVEYLEWLEEREKNQEDGLVEKSRDMGLTWLSCGFAIHRWLHRAGYAAGFGSRKYDYVDKLGDPDCIFEKLRFIIRKLPFDQLPVGWEEKKHSRLGLLMNPVTRATITGEGGDQIGRGGRKSIYFVDEAAYIEHPSIIDRALSQTTRTRIFISTPNNPGDLFDTKRHSGSIKVFTFNWQSDPRKSQEWHDAEVARIGRVAVAREIDIDYTASIEGIAIPGMWVRAAVDLILPPPWETEEVTTENDHNDERWGPVVGGQDVADGGANKCVFIARRGPLFRWPVDWEGVNTSLTAWKVRDEARAAGVSVLHYDAVGVGAGLRGVFDTSEEELGFTPSAINTGVGPTDRMWPDEQTSRQKFLNLRAELWWTVRDRFEKTYEYVNGIAYHPVEELISIPNHPQLIAELSRPLSLRTQTGKIAIERKEAMQRRNVASPDFADAFVLTFAPEPLVWDIF